MVRVKESIGRQDKHRPGLDKWDKWDHPVDGCCRRETIDSTARDDNSTAAPAKVAGQQRNTIVDHCRKRPLPIQTNPLPKLCYSAPLARRCSALVPPRGEPRHPCGRLFAPGLRGHPHSQRPLLQHSPRRGSWQSAKLQDPYRPSNGRRAPAVKARERELWHSQQLSQGGLQQQRRLLHLRLINPRDVVGDLTVTLLRA